MFLQVFEPLVTGRDQVFTSLTKVRVQLLLIQCRFDGHVGLKVGIDDELSDCGGALQMGFGLFRELIDRDPAQDIAQVQEALVNSLDLLTTNLTQIPFITLGHTNPLFDHVLTEVALRGK